MDNLSHSLTGFTLARAGLNRVTPRAMFLLILSANIPDIDFVTVAQSQITYLEVHRGPTHSLLGVPLLAAVCVLIVAAICRQRLPWFRAWAVCCVGLLSHLLLDWTNNYGIRPLVPFSGEWFHLDLNSLTDGVIVSLLTIAVIWPLLSRLVSGEIGERKKSTGQGIAIAVLVSCLLFEGYRYYLHADVVAQLQSRLYGGEEPLDVVAFPAAVNPYRWLGIVSTGQTYQQFQVDDLGQLHTEAGQTFFRSIPPEVTSSARRTREVTSFLYFARFPVWSAEPVELKDGTGRRVDLTDLRFGEPGRGSFHAIVLQSPRGAVLGSWYTFGNGANLGWGETKGR